MSDQRNTGNNCRDRDETMNQHAREVLNPDGEFDEVIDAAHGEMRVKHGGTELLPHGLKGKQHHRDKINGVSMSYDVSQDTWWWSITFDDTQMPSDYRTSTGDGWVIQQACLVSFPRKRLFGVIPTSLRKPKGFVIRVRKRGDRDE